jgi:peroxiredoxin
VIIATAIIFSCNNKDETGKNFVVSGTIKNTTSFKVYLMEMPVTGGQPPTLDSASIEKDGKFTLKTKAVGEKIYMLQLQNTLFPFLSVVNDAASVKVNADFNNKTEFYTVQGSVASEKIKQIAGTYPQKWSNLYRIRKEYDSLKNAKGPDSSITRLNSEGTAAFADMKNGIYKYLKESNSPAFSYYVLKNFQNIFTVEEYSAELDSAMKKFPGSVVLVQAKNVLDQTIAAAREKQANQTLVGKAAPEISLPDVNGKQVTLSSFKGKYVLVDFWASWCGPCRAENPNVVSAYNKFKNKNFTILGVSLDQPDGKKKWLKAIKDDKLAWTQVSDLKFWDSEVVPVYHIDAIPFNVLVGPDGKVIAEKLRGPDLENKLNEILK